MEVEKSFKTMMAVMVLFYAAIIGFFGWVIIKLLEFFGVI